MNFAIFCRVSTDGQEKNGFSLQQQQEILTNLVKNHFRERLVKVYSGSESATEGKRRPLLDKMLIDAEHGIFDALVIYDLSRLTRNEKDKIRVREVFIENDITLYEKTTECDFNDEDDDFMIGIKTLMNAKSAKQLSKRSLEVKLELARKGFPVSNPPFGRRLVNSKKDETAIYEIIPEAKKLAEDFYHSYVDMNFGLEKIANIHSTNLEKVRNVLFKYSGSEWIRVFGKGKKQEIIITKLPALLTDDQIQQIKIKASENKKFNSRINNYLLSSYLKCGVCSANFKGAGSTKTKKFYYLHSRNYKTDICPKTINRDMIEHATLFALSSLFGSVTNLKKVLNTAIRTSRNDYSNQKELLDKLINRQVELEKQKTNLVNAISNGIVLDNDIREKMTEIREEYESNKKDINVIENKIQSSHIELPDKICEEINDLYNQMCSFNGNSLSEWPFYKLQKLIKWFFGNHTENGVFIEKNHNVVQFRVVGTIGGTLVGAVEEKLANCRVYDVEEINTNFDTKSTKEDFSNIFKFLTNEISSHQQQVSSKGNICG